MARREELLHLRYNQRREDLIDFFLMLFPKVDKDMGQQLALRLVQQSRGTVSQIKILSCEEICRFSKSPSTKQGCRVSQMGTNT